jgi:hypothetical protein
VVLAILHTHTHTHTHTLLGRGGTRRVVLAGLGADVLGVAGAGEVLAVLVEGDGHHLARERENERGRERERERENERQRECEERRCREERGRMWKVGGWGGIQGDTGERK